MSYDPSSLDEPADRPGRLSPNGQMVCIGVYGFLVLVGFFFGIVTGYDSPKPVVVKAPKEKEREAPKVTAKPAPQKPDPKVEPKEDPKPEPKLEEPKKEDPKPEPKKEEAKPEPKKVEPTPVTVAISFEKQVRPILMRYCGNCHGNAGKPKGDVDLRTLAAITDPKNPPILKPGDPKGSALLTTIEDMSMPPNGPRPGKGETDVIREWIKGGAKPRRRRTRR